MKNLFLLPTDKPSRLIIQNGNKLILGKEEYSITENKQNIYITSDEEIKEGDWVYYENGDLKGIHKVVNGQIPKTMILKKIILTTDQDLIKDGVQAIDDEFLEWFVKNPSCEWVEVEKISLGKVEGTTMSVSKYKIIIPKEETNGCIGINGVSDPKLNEVQLNQSKKETLEEVVGKEFQFNSSTVIKDEKYVYLMDKHSFNIAVDNILKWQQEQDNNKFSEEDMIRFANLYSDIDINESHLKYFNNLPKFKNK